MENNLAEKHLDFNSDIKTSLESIRRWVLFLSIVGSIFMLLMIILGFSMGSFTKLMTGNDSIPGYSSFLFGAIYMVFGIIYFFPILYLFRFTSYTQKGIRDNDQNSIELAFKNLKSHFAYVGVFTIIMMGIYVLMGLIFAIIAITG